MRLLAFLLLTLCLYSLPAQAAPPECEPAPNGPGTYAVQGRVEDVGEYHYWFCPGTFTWRLSFVVKRDDFVLRHPNVAGMTRAEALKAYYTANMTGDVNSPELMPLTQVVRKKASEVWPARIRYVVAKNGTSMTRPVYPYGATQRLSISSGRIPVGATCDTTLHFVENGVVYAKVADGAVALCVKVL
jgi:hypothetical protein